MLIACFTFNFALKIVAMSRQAMTTIKATIYKEGKWIGGGGVALLQNLFLPPLGVVCFAG